MAMNIFDILTFPFRCRSRKKINKNKNARKFSKDSEEKEEEAKKGVEINVLLSH